MEIVFTQEEKEKIVCELMENYPEASSPSLTCIGWKYKECKFIFEEYVDMGDIKRHTVTKDMLVKGFDIMMKEIANGHYHHLPLTGIVGDLGDWDADDVDALVQFSVFGELVYG